MCLLKLAFSNFRASLQYPSDAVNDLVKKTRCFSFVDHHMIELDYMFLSFLMSFCAFVGLSSTNGPLTKPLLF